MLRFNLDDGASNLNVYVGSDGLIHFTDWTGADSALPFSSGISIANSKTATITSTGNSYSFSLPGTVIDSIYAVEWFSNALVANCDVSGGTVLDSHMNSASGGWGGIIKATKNTISFSGFKHGTGGITAYACELV